MLRKKYTVQKSFRVDYQLSDDLEYLCKILDRSQNDLVNIALEDLINDNQIWFIEDIIIEYSRPFFDTLQDFELKIDEMNILFDAYPDDKYVILTITMYKEAKCVLDIEDTYTYDNLEKLKKDLRQFSKYLDIEGRDVQKYLKNRLNYK